MKFFITIIVVGLYTLIPFFAGQPASAPTFFELDFAGVPMSALFVGALLAIFPIICWISSLMATVDAKSVPEGE